MGTTGATITVQVDGLPEIKQALDALKARFSGRRVMAVIAGAMLKQTLQRFQKEVDPEGKPWKPTRRGETILRGSPPRLMQSITASWTDNTAQVGTNARYAAIHQFGGEIRPDKAGALAIPISPQALQHSKNGGKPKDFPKPLTLIWPKGKPTGWLVETKKGSKKQGIGAKTIFHYLLTGGVSMPARPFFGLGAGDRQEILRLLADFRLKSP